MAEVKRSKELTSIIQAIGLDKIEFSLFLISGIMRAPIQGILGSAGYG